MTKENRLADDIVMVVVILMAIGTVFVFSAGVNVSQELNLQRFYDSVGMRQMVFFPLACLVMFTISCFDYNRFTLEKGCS